MLKDIHIEAIKEIAVDAGKIVMAIYRTNFEVAHKEDESPLTQADIQANELICNQLQKAYPTIAIISEESRQMAFEIRKDWEYYWCIDPIDGTKEFVKKSGEFTINIALIHKGVPVLGVVYAPALGEIYWAKKSQGAFKELLNGKGEVLKKEQLPLYVNEDKKESLHVVASVSHVNQATQEFIETLAHTTKALTLHSLGSSLKLCLIASGQADIYPRLSPTMEWDTAAADAIVREVGKMTYEYDAHFSIENLALATPLVYNKKELLNPWFVVL
ncbi:MAG: 3'(2'),5'-bisphosphate nucleotidase CysQ [Arcobacteraceae bacterium]